jgi:hypothetical protein
MFWLKPCPHCFGDLHLEKDFCGGYVACLQCGHELSEFEELMLGCPTSGVEDDLVEEAIASAA